MNGDQSLKTCIPTEREDVHGDDRWMAQHMCHLRKATRSDPEIVFVGDTILYHLGLNSAWNKVLAPMHAVNFSIPGDATQHILWRIQQWASPHQGNVDWIEPFEGLKPKVFVVHVGTEMYDSNTEEVSMVIGVVIHFNKQEIR